MMFKKVTHPCGTYMCMNCLYEDKEMWMYDVDPHLPILWFCSRRCYRKMIKEWINL